MKGINKIPKEIALAAFTNNIKTLQNLNKDSIIVNNYRKKVRYSRNIINIIEEF